MIEYEGSSISSPYFFVTDFILFYYQQALPLRLGKPQETQIFFLPNPGKDIFSTSAPIPQSLKGHVIGSAEVICLFLAQLL